MLASPSPHWALREFKELDYANMRRNGMTAGLDGGSKVSGDVSPTVVKADLLYDIITSATGKKFFDEVYSIGIGNPYYQEYDGRKLTHSDVSNVFNAWRLYTYLKEPSLVVEIGGGFGCLAAQLKRVWPTTKFIMVDLPESIKLQKYYLSESFPENTDDFSYQTDMQGINKADLVINIRSMMEMTQPQIRYYLTHIQNMDFDWFYCVNRYFKYHKLKDYPFDDHWAIYVSQQLTAQQHHHEYLLKRMKDQCFTLQLRTLPDK